MPELPDITIYIEALEKRLLGERMEQIEIRNPFLLRTAVPPIQTLLGRTVSVLRRLGKRIVFGFGEDLWLILHLMIAGRLHWKDGKEERTKSKGIATLRFPAGTLTLTEAGTKKRASLHLVQGAEGLREHNRGGLEVFDSTLKTFESVLTRRNHTLKRALTDPSLFSGIGNAYSDEILHGARLSPIAMTQKLSDFEIARLHHSVRETLHTWTARLRDATGNEFPKNVTAFRPEMAVHGKFGRPCPVCGTKVQRIRYASNETNYCPKCQTGGKLLADRSLSLLLKRDWPKSLEALDELRAGGLLA